MVESSNLFRGESLCIFVAFVIYRNMRYGKSYNKRPGAFKMCFFKRGRGAY